MQLWLIFSAATLIDRSKKTFSGVVYSPFPAPDARLVAFTVTGLDKILTRSFKMLIDLSNKLTISEDPEFLESVIQDRLTFANPKYLDNLKMNRWNCETPEYLKFYDYTENGDMILPRGFISQLVSLCRHYGSDFKI